jgi:riboflavin kinase/FMN adenylyltransferase
MRRRAARRPASDVRTVHGLSSHTAADGPIVAVVGVFDGLHLGHAYLIEHLVREAAGRAARPAVITFDAHPDAVLLGHAPPLLMDPAERLERLAGEGVEVVVVEHFDDALRQTAYDAFIAGITERCRLAAIVMTPDAAFGHDRGGTPATVAALGAREGFDTVVVPPFELDGREVRSSDIRAAIRAGDRAGAGRLLGRPSVLRGTVREGRLETALPMAMPPEGHYRCRIDGRSGELTIAPAGVLLPVARADRPVQVELPA